MTAGAVQTSPLKNPKQERYCQLRAEGKGQAAAYAEAGYRANSSHAARLGAKAHIKARMAEIMRPALTEIEVTIERTTGELARIAFGAGRKLYDEQGQLRPVQELDADTAAMIGGVKRRVTTFGSKEDGSHGEAVTIEVKLWSKTTALETLAMILKMVGAGAVPLTPQKPLRIEDHETHRLLRRITEQIGGHALERLKAEDAAREARRTNGDDESGRVH